MRKDKFETKNKKKKLNTDNQIKKIAALWSLDSFFFKFSIVLTARYKKGRRNKT